MDGDKWTVGSEFQFVILVLILSCSYVLMISFSVLLATFRTSPLEKFIMQDVYKENVSTEDFIHRGRACSKSMQSILVSQKPRVSPTRTRPERQKVNSDTTLFVCNTREILQIGLGMTVVDGGARG